MRWMVILLTASVLLVGCEEQAPYIINTGGGSSGSNASAEDSINQYRYYLNGSYITGSVTGLSFTTATAAEANKIVLYPILIENNIRVDIIGAKVATANASLNCTIGLYNSTFQEHIGYRPGSLLVQHNFMASSTTFANTDKNAFSLDLKGLYWGAYICQTTGGTGRLNLLASSQILTLMGANTAAATQFTSYQLGQNFNLVAGVLPATMNDTAHGLTLSASLPVAIYLRVRTDS